MNPREVWPDFRDDQIVFRDGAILVVDKPAGVPTQAADPERPDDLVTRLKRHLGVAYLGVHQRLDRDTSGLMVFALAKEANASLARQFEGRALEKTYVAAVLGTLPEGKRFVLRDALAKGEEGRMEVVSPRARGAQLAVTHGRVLGRRGERALVELKLETGRTHQARVQLASAGAPIAGDTLYGGATAPRLLLHAAELAFEHPITRAPVRFRAKAPAAFDTWLAHGDRGFGIYDDDTALRAALDVARERRFGLGRSDGPRETTAFRLVNEAGDGLPGLAVDVYGAFLVAQFYEDGETFTPERRDRILDALAALGFDGIYEKRRPRQANVIVDARREEFAPRAPVRGSSAPETFAIVEEGIPYRVRLGDGLSTGLFLDQRENRRRVRELARGLRVLNLFAYTCGFTLAAAVGGAARTVSVDAAANVLERGRENLAAAGLLEAGAHAFIAEDVFAWLARSARKGELFDLIVLDPPSYSKTKKHRFSSESDYGHLVAKTLGLLAPGGRLLACSNHRGIGRGRFRRLVRAGAEEAGARVVQLKDMPDPSDYPPPPGRECHLKTCLLTVAGR